MSIVGNFFIDYWLIGYRLTADNWTIGKLDNWKIAQDRPQSNSPEVSESSDSSASPSANNFGQKTEQTANENIDQMGLIEKEKEFIYF